MYISHIHLGSIDYGDTYKTPTHVDTSVINHSNSTRRHLFYFADV